MTDAFMLQRNMAKQNPLRNTWKDYLTFSRRERRGVFILSTILILEISCSYFIHFMRPAFTLEDLKIYELSMDSFMKLQPDIVETSGEGNVGTARQTMIHESTSVNQAAPLFFFDPNNLDDSTGKALGFSEKQISVIRNYCSKGGKFRVADDLSKMYCIGKDQFNKLSPWIRLEEKKYSEKTKQFSNHIEKTVIEINTADSLAFLSLPGIGPGFTHRIITYRDNLGGFISLNQLKEVWGFSDSLFELIRTKIILRDTIPFRFIQLNSMSEDSLRRHPYIGYRFSRIFFNYRQQHGPFKSMEEVRSVPLLSPENYSKLAPYLRLH